MNAEFWQEYKGCIVDRFVTEEMVYSEDSPGLYEPKQNSFIWRDGHVFLHNSHDVAIAETLDDWQAWKAAKTREANHYGEKIINRGML